MRDEDKPLWNAAGALADLRRERDGARKLAGLMRRFFREYDPVHTCVESLTYKFDPTRDDCPACRWISAVPKEREP